MRKNVFWACTYIGAGILIVMGIFNLLQLHFWVNQIAKLTYPDWVMRAFGVVSIAAGVTLIIPGYLKLKEWAYCGSVFLMIGAISSHAMAKDEFIKIGLPIITLIALLISYLMLSERFKGYGEE
jgi:uncharacterized protein YjeT (DUF2065 family)